MVNTIQTQKDLRDKIISYKNIAEANTIAILFANPECLYTSELKLEDYDNNIWRVYYSILDGCISEGKEQIDEIVIGQYLEAHSALKNKYEEFGGWQTIQDMKSFARTGNLEAEIENLHKWGIVKKLQEAGFPMSSKKLSHYADIETSTIYDELSAILNNTFVNTSMNVEAEDAFDNILEHCEELDKGKNIGLPAYNMPLLNAMTGGIIRNGEVVGLGGLSGEGKSLFAFMWLVPTCIESNKRIVFIINEESVERFRTELLIWFANNKLNKTLTKNTLRNGRFNKETWDILKECAEEIKKYQNQHLFTIVPLEKWSIKSAEKIIRKYAALGVDTFVIDTFKSSTESLAKGEQEWLSLAQDMVEIYDIIKAAGLNVGLLTTYQLGKGSMKQRVFTNNNIARAKNIVDIMSLNIMVRSIQPEEYPGESKAIKVYRIEDKKRIPITLDTDKKYMILFVTKNRHGEANTNEIVFEIDMAKDIIKEIGYCRIIDDSFS